MFATVHGVASDPIWDICYLGKFRLPGARNCPQGFEWLENWKKWIFSDESPVVVGTNNRIYVRRKDNEVNNPHLVCPSPRRKVSVMVWDCLLYYGIGTLCHVAGIINAQKYINIIDNNFWPIIAWHFRNNEYTFMDGNAPVHGANIVKTYKETNQINETVSRYKHYREYLAQNKKRHRKSDFKCDHPTAAVWLD